MKKSKIPVREYTWLELLKQDFVYGIPLFYNGTPSSCASKHDKNLLYRGIIHRFPSFLRWKFAYLGERSRCTSGVRIEFTTDASAIKLLIKTKYMKHRENFSNMAQAAMDILVDGRFWALYYPRWKNLEKIYLPDDGMVHRISLVFPNYASIKLEKIILFNLTEFVHRSPEYLLNNRPIIHYGSSITQGGCSSRPALAFPHLLSETFCVNHINLGISGNARGEPEIADYVANFSNAILFILEWGANLLDLKWDDLLEQRYEKFWRTIHNSNPNTPILFVGLQNFSYDICGMLEIRMNIQKKREFIQKQALAACKEVNKNGLKLFDYIDGTTIINSSRLDLTIEGIHPNDKGHRAYAESMKCKIINLLGNHITA
ncbi:MAG: hypothetical protein JW776_06840 [Candidatus Lokiarchaeota archaeon]|nr:hypothetical protein [Candidatus Lokiarchaeota archaeon]